MSGRDDVIDPAVGDAPQTLLLAMEQLVSGERTVAEFRDEMVNLLYEQPSAASATRGLVDDYARRGLVPEQIHRLLIGDIDKATTEDQPTTPTQVSLAGESTDALDATSSNGTDAAKQPSEPVPSGGRRAGAAGNSGPLEVGSMLRDRFEIVGRAHGGSMGVVYKAVDHRLAEAEGGRPHVAIKVLAPGYAGHGGAMRALQQEAAKGRYLSHPNIVRFLDLDRCDGRIFLVMEWLEGRALSALLNERTGEPMPMDTALDIIAAVGAALIHAHRVGVTHADVKPGNIMLQPGGGVKLLDFGIARARGDLAGKTMAFDNSILQAATPAYASPQVLAGNPARPIDDVFSLACVTYRLLSGRRPFGERTSLEAKEEGLRPQRIDGIGGRRWRAIEAALALDDAARTSSVDAFLDALGIDAKRRRGTAAWAMGLAAALVAALAGVAILSPRLGLTPATGPAAPAPVERPAPDERPAPQQDAPLTGTQEPAAAAPSAAPPPEPRFEVTRADPVPEAAPRAPAALTLQLPSEDAVVPAVYAELRLFEDAGPSVIRLQRANAREAQALQLVVSAESEALQVATRDSFAISPSAPAFEAGQTELDLAVEHLPDGHVEPDTPVRLALLAADGAVLARITLELIDDDRGLLAAGLEPDTVGFSRPEYVVAENEAAVTLTLWRFNPRAGALEVGITLSGRSARVDEDFVAPATDRVRFAPDEPAAVVYLPVVLDNVPEPEETLDVTIQGDDVPDGIYRSTTVRIIDGTG